MTPSQFIDTLNSNLDPEFPASLDRETPEGFQFQFEAGGYIAVVLFQEDGVHLLEDASLEDMADSYPISYPNLEELAADIILQFKESEL